MMFGFRGAASAYATHCKKPLQSAEKSVLRSKDLDKAIKGCCTIQFLAGSSRSILTIDGAKLALSDLSELVDRDGE